jgi:hypothetical protein
MPPAATGFVNMNDASAEIFRRGSVGAPFPPTTAQMRSSGTFKLRRQVKLNHLSAFPGIHPNPFVGSPTERLG